MPPITLATLAVPAAIILDAITSGAGTGKTKVLTTRLANIIYTRKGGIKDILCVTFTNKAAFEMKMRVEKILKTPVEGMFIGTFHSIGARFLRRHASLINSHVF